MTEDETAGRHHQLNGHESEQTLGDSEGQGSLACCSPQGHRVGHDSVTEEQQKRYSYCPFSYKSRNSLGAESVLHVMHSPAPNTVPEIQAGGLSINGVAQYELAVLILSPTKLRL